MHSSGWTRGNAGGVHAKGLGGSGRRRGRGAGGFPIRGRKFDAPEVRRRGNEFEAEPEAALGGTADVDDAAFLVLFGSGAAQSDQRAHIHLRVEIEEGAVRVDDDRFGLLGELVAANVASGRANLHAGKHARTAPLIVRFRCSHTRVSCAQAGGGVNPALRACMRLPSQAAGRYWSRYGRTPGDVHLPRRDDGA